MSQCRSCQSYASVYVCNKCGVRWCVNCDVPAGRTVTACPSCRSTSTTDPDRSDVRINTEKRTPSPRPAKAPPRASSPSRSGSARSGKAGCVGLVIILLVGSWVWSKFKACVASVTGNDPVVQQVENHSPPPAGEVPGPTKSPAPRQVFPVAPPYTESLAGATTLGGMPAAALGEWTAAYVDSSGVRRDDAWRITVGDSAMEGLGEDLPRLNAIIHGGRLGFTGEARADENPLPCFGIAEALGVAGRVAWVQGCWEGSEWDLRSAHTQMPALARLLQTGEAQQEGGSAANLPRAWRGLWRARDDCSTNEAGWSVELTGSTMCLWGSNPAAGTSPSLTSDEWLLDLQGEQSGSTFHFRAKGFGGSHHDFGGVSACSGSLEARGQILAGSLHCEWPDYPEDKEIHLCKRVTAWPTLPRPGAVHE